jgi:hypothetical protein
MLPCDKEIISSVATNWKFSHPAAERALYAVSRIVARNEALAEPPVLSRPARFG